jgi:hypothetical protein
MKISTQNLLRGPGGIYFAKMTFGSSNPPQSFNLLVDTGSSWNWVASCNKTTWKGDKCPSYYFNESLSSTLTCSDKTKRIGYLGSAVEGPICEDEV